MRIELAAFGAASVASGILDLEAMSAIGLAGSRIFMVVARLIAQPPTSDSAISFLETFQSKLTYLSAVQKLHVETVRSRSNRRPLILPSWVSLRAPLDCRMRVRVFRHLQARGELVAFSDLDSYTALCG
jgi:hypothetical protein